MKVFACTNFQGHWPVGAGAIIVALDKFEAADLLNKQIQFEKISLPDNFVGPNDMIEVDLRVPKAYIIVDGNY